MSAALKFLLLFLVLTGCAQTRLGLRESGLRREFTSTQSPGAVAQCIARNGEENILIDSSRIGDREQPGTLEYSSRNSVSGAFLLAVIEPNGAGSRILTYVNGNAVAWIRQDQAELIMKGC
jgi:hypothetical protein